MVTDKILQFLLEINVIFGFIFYIIRSPLFKVAVENGKKLDPHDDPIHDQSTYLDSRLRQRLYTEYGVHGYTIIQCAGKVTAETVDYTDY